MEAASARYAARDRFGPFGEAAQTPLQRYIQNAVDPQQNYEPNLALSLEIADLINSKKGSAPREASVAIVNHVNHRNANISLLALSLLDICVKNCGYPFHLQISTKEFLNELVRRFPERPPIRPSRVQSRILELIEEWRQTICQTSRYKEDLGFIRDMHRLLSFKGYMFPEVRREDAAVLNRSENLQSAEEMEEEEKAAQSAKLQELIRRGGPQDLQEANRLMKVMAGFDTRHKTDYRAKAAEEVSRVQQKARLLEERLQNFKPGDKVVEGDVFEVGPIILPRFSFSKTGQELVSALQSAHPKIQRMCEEESDDAEAVAKLLEINDSIHRTIERYKLVKQGDLEAASKIPKGTLGTSTGVTKTGDNELSLIDFSGEAESQGDANGNTDATGGQRATSVEDDLLGLSIQNQDYGQSGGIALGFGANTNIPGPSLLSSTTQGNSARAPSDQPPAYQQPTLSHPKPNYDPFSSVNSSSRHASGTSTPAGFSSFQSQFQQPPKSTQTAPDPFASLSSPQPSQSVQPSQIPQASASASLFDFSSSSTQPTPKPPASTQKTNVAVTKGLTLKLTPQSGRNLLPSQKDGITQPIVVNGVQKGQANGVKMRWKASYRMQGEPRQEQGEVPPLGIE
ncbi:uncharacterized protein KY384_005784 [Bacidia gigantensis]|uniref:uncharacterized protein n=1 Tax=Bacidia gigantensis TaxID=2732470 RepID=UPI001D048246|nr:uncharacterized protein KY384_005784 [Bacidia gigantensis]KAG8529149.1 hypothetical protein KY384_005784 [Bacidia gigantensis]